MHRPLREKRHGVPVKSNHLPRLDTATRYRRETRRKIGGNYCRPERSGWRLVSREVTTRTINSYRERGKEGLT